MSKKVFIGHGRSLVWLQLKAFLNDRLHLACDEFNAEAVAGITTTARLQRLLHEASFAFLVMTAEDTHSDKSLHARENVIHEAGLFQGRLGFERAIILLEEGCAQFSNIHGLTHISFTKENLESALEQVRRVLERENLHHAEFSGEQTPRTTIRAEPETPFRCLNSPRAAILVPDEGFGRRWPASRWASRHAQDALYWLSQ